MRAMLATSVLMVLLAVGGHAEACPKDPSTLSASERADFARLAAQADLQVAAESAIEYAQAPVARTVPPVREPAPLFTVPRAVRLYGMFLFVVGLLLTQALLAPWLLKGRRPR